MHKNIRLASLVAVVCLAGLSGSDRSVVDELEKVLSVAGDDGQLLTVLAHSIELVGESCLELLSGNVRQLGLGHERLGLRADKLLLEYDDLGRVGLLVLQLRNLVGDLLLACMTVSGDLVLRVRQTYGHGWAGPKPRCCGCS
jgi:hypothetical protein